LANETDELIICVTGRIEVVLTILRIPKSKD